MSKTKSDDNPPQLICRVVRTNPEAPDDEAVYETKIIREGDWSDYDPTKKPSPVLIAFWRRVFELAEVVRERVKAARLASQDSVTVDSDQLTG